MNKLFKTADRYVQTADWKLIAVLKFCLLALGILAGLALPKKAKKPATIGSLAVFAVTYVPLMVRLVKMFRSEED